MEKCNNGGGTRCHPFQGSIKVIGTGPGDISLMTEEARVAIEQSDCIVGYDTYLKLIQPLLHEKEVISSHMMQEVKRCEYSFELAENGKKVALISGGDPGIYAMAGLVLEIASVKNSNIDIDIIPGLAALNSCAARLGAPLMHDFAAVSLSDLLTPLDIIEKRIEAAAKADFVLVIYNPKSKKRTEHIKKARKILLQYREKNTPVGVVTGATRLNESVVISDLEHFLECEINMQSTLIVGNSKTYRWKDKMITPRGYADKYSLEK